MPANLISLPLPVRAMVRSSVGVDEDRDCDFIILFGGDLSLQPEKGTREFSQVHGKDPRF
jgi:hypothetical protein